MTTETQIESYLATQPAPKQADLRALHALIQRLAPGARLWFLDGTDDAGKIVSNPNIGYGDLTIRYADGTSRDFYQVGLSANTSGISIYVMGLDDKTYLARTFGLSLGKASITGYCVKFRALKDLDPATLEGLLRFGLSPR